MKIANTTILEKYKHCIARRDTSTTKKEWKRWYNKAKRELHKYNQIIRLRNLGLLDARHIIQEVPFSEGIGSKIFPEFLED